FAPRPAGGSPVRTLGAPPVLALTLHIDQTTDRIVAVLRDARGRHNTRGGGNVREHRGGREDRGNRGGRGDSGCGGRAGRTPRRCPEGGYPRPPSWGTR